MIINKNESVMVDNIDDLYVLLNRKNNKIFELNQMGYLIWMSIADGMEKEHMCTIISENTEDLPNNFIKEIDDYMDLMNQEGIINFSDEKSKLSLSDVRANFVKKFIKEVGYHVLKYRGSSMASVFNEGQMVLVEKFSPETIQIGDIVIFSMVDSVELVIHRIIDVKSDEIGEKKIVTKGDNCDDTDEASIEKFAGKAIIPKILKPKNLFLKKM